MQFIVTGHDGTDDNALERRLAARSEHLTLIDSMKSSGNLLYAVALLDDLGKMIGSVMIFDFSTREDLDEWLKIEPYVIGDVWKDITVKPCQVPPGFLV